MATNQTTNYDLNQWLSTDQVLRTDFNADNAKIDAALAALSQLVTGTYEGDGTAERFISLGFTPKALLVFRQEGYPATGSNSLYGGMAFLGTPAQVLTSPNTYTSILSITEGGFQVYYSSYHDIRSNQADTVYHYMAWK